MQITRGLIGTAIIAAGLMLVLRCTSASVERGAGTGEAGLALGDLLAQSSEHAATAAQRSAEAMVAQSQAVRLNEGPRGQRLGTIAPGETWRGTVTFKYGPESVSLDGSSHSGRAAFRDLELKLLHNHWGEYGVTGRVESVRVDSYTYDIWQLENQKGLLVPRPLDGSLDLEALGRLSRDQILQVKWQHDPRLKGFDPQWDLRRGRAQSQRATVAVAITAPRSLIWPKGKQDRNGGDLYFGSQYQGLGVVLGLLHDHGTGGFVVVEGSFSGGPLVANPYRDRFAAGR